MKSMLWALSIGIVAAVGCKGKGQIAGGAQPAGQQGVEGMKMDSMPMRGDHLGMAGSDLMPMMRAQMDSMMRVSPQQMSGLMAAHDQMMSQMMDRMGSDMRSMNMTGDATWNSLMDSVKADLADLPSLQGKDLSTRMKQHADRVRRLISIHEGMMKSR